ncbi:MAG TPA: methyltransferase domain-containing protein [Candidatus Paceibacterota bacterium]|nr:methyltransferase domain-containing protein [Candidatus Paceibacterota bacterium]
MAFTDPQANLAILQLEPGMHVADFGCGTGAYALLAADLVGPHGVVYTVDVQKELLEALKAEAVRRGIKNVEVVWGDIERTHGTKLADGLVDAVIFSNVLFQTSAKYQAVSEARRILKPGGKVLVIDWSDSFGGLGPHPDHVSKEEDVEAVFVEAGFSKRKRFDAGDHHFGFLFIK